jgi:hypothetical protein
MHARPLFAPFAGMTRIRFGGSRPCKPPLSRYARLPGERFATYSPRGKGQGGMRPAGRTRGRPLGCERGRQGDTMPKGLPPPGQGSRPSDSLPAWRWAGVFAAWLVGAGWRPLHHVFWVACVTPLHLAPWANRALGLVTNLPHSLGWPLAVQTLLILPVGLPAAGVLSRVVRPLPTMIALMLAFGAFEAFPFDWVRDFVLPRSGRLASAYAALGVGLPILIALRVSFGFWLCVALETPQGVLGVLRSSFAMGAGSRWRLAAALALAEGSVFAISALLGAWRAGHEVFRAVFIGTGFMSGIWWVLVALAYRRARRLQGARSEGLAAEIFA